MRLEATNRKKKAHENVTPLRPLLGLVFACIMNSNEYSVIWKNVIFKAFMNIWSTVDCMRERYWQIGKPTFDLRQALDRLLRSHVPQTTVVRIFTLWRHFKGVLCTCEIFEDNCRKTYQLGTFGKQFTNPEWNVLIKMWNKKRCNLQNEIVKALMTSRLQFSHFGEARHLALFFWYCWRCEEFKSTFENFSSSRLSVSTLWSLGLRQSDWSCFLEKYP